MENASHCVAFGTFLQHAVAKYANIILFVFPDSIYIPDLQRDQGTHNTKFLQNPKNVRLFSNL